MQFAPVVEQWRPLVSQYVSPQYVDKALWIINYESGGQPYQAGDGGVSIGLFQIQDNQVFAGRPSKEQLLDPTFNIQYAATQWINHGDFTPWGEGVTYNGQPFGALGNHPFPAQQQPNPNAGDTTLGIPGTGVGIDVNNIPVVGGAAATVLDANKAIVQGAVNAATASLGVLKMVGQGLAWLLDPHHWFRLFFIAAGVVLVIVGGHMYVRGNDATGDYRKFAEMGAFA